MFLDGFAKKGMRKKVIELYLNAYVKLNNGTELGSWGVDWKQQGYNDVCTFFKEYQPNILFDFCATHVEPTTINMEKDYIYTPYKVLSQIYFRKEPTSKDLNKLKKDFEEEGKRLNLLIQ